MNNFGVIEVAGARTTAAPGWAYVPDMGPGPGPGGLQPANRKRARNAPGGGLSLGDLSARQEAKARKEVEALDGDSGKDNSIPLPVRSGRAQVKYTPNVRRIMQSQKTFANHLDDFLAMQALAEANPGAQSSSARPGGSGSGSGAKRPATSKKDAAAKPAARDEDTDMADAGALEAPILTPAWRPAPPAHPDDGNALLASRVPPLPSDEELRKLLAHPPLTYLEARGRWEGRYPTRVFCAVCGYWGRVRCIKCGTRVCALDCLETHREECVTRYGL